MGPEPFWGVRGMRGAVMPADRKLTQLHQRVLSGLADGETLGEIAREVALSEQAMRTVLASAVSVIGARSVAHAVVIYDRVRRIC